MKIILTYKDGNNIEVKSPYSTRKDKDRPIRVRVSDDIRRNSYEWNKLRLSMKPGYEWDIGYIDG